MINKIDKEYHPKQHRIVLCKDPESLLKPTLIFIASLPGDALEMVNRAFLKMASMKKIPAEAADILLELWNPEISNKKSSTLRKRLEEIFAGQNRSEHYILQAPGDHAFSFPFGNNYLWRPDLLDLILMAEPFFNVKILVTLQYLEDSLEFALRKWPTACKTMPRSEDPHFRDEAMGKCSSVYLNSKTIELNLIYLTRQLKALSQEYYQVLWFEEVRANHSTTFFPLKKFLGLTNGDTAILLKAVVHGGPRIRSGKDLELTVSQRKSLEQMFHSSRPLQWSFLFKDEIDVQNYSEEEQHRWRDNEECYNPAKKVTPMGLHTVKKAKKPKV